jgi:hypothetical protein
MKCTYEYKQCPVTKNQMFVHTGGCYRLEASMGDHGLSLLITDLSVDRRTGGNYGICTAITNENIAAFMQWLDTHIPRMLYPRFAVVRTRNDRSDGSVCITRDVMSAEQCVRYHEDHWLSAGCNDDETLIDKFMSMRVGDTITRQRMNSFGEVKDTFVCIAERQG